MEQWEKWIDVITQPLGLVGFALFLVFIYLPKIDPKKNLPWLPKAAYTMALITLLGGIGLAFSQSQTKKSENSPTKTAPEAPTTSTLLEQKTSGDNSPTLGGIKGNIDINIGQGNKEPSATQSEFPRKESKKFSPQSARTAEPSPRNSTSKIKQETKGKNSPAVAGAKGNIVITIE